MRLVSSFAAVLLAGVALSACATTAAQNTAPAFDAARISEDIRVLSDDSFQGRGSGTPADIRKAGQYTVWNRVMSLPMMCRSAGPCSRCKRNWKPSSAVA